MGVGIIVRNQEGNALASMCPLKQFIVDHVVVETYAGWKAVEFNRDMIMLNTNLERDALEIVNALWMEGQSWNRYI